MPSTDQNTILARYQRAQTLEQGVFSKKIAFNTTLYPHWIGDTDSFWYVRESREGQTFRWVDASAGTNNAAFDHDRLAAALSATSGETLAADNLPLTALDLTGAPQLIEFSAFNQRWRFDGATNECETIESLPDHWLVSPDGKKAAFAKDYNLWVRDLATGKDTALTQDGARLYEYASLQPMSIYGLQSPSASLQAVWSPDSRRIFTHLIDLRELGIAPPLVQHVPADGSLRPVITNPDSRVAQVGDQHIESYRFLSLEVASGDVQWADYAPSPVMYPPYAGYFTAQLGWWNKDGRHAYFVDQERGGKTVNVIKLDTHTGATTQLFQDQSDFAVTLIPLSHIRPLLVPLPETDEVIWFSERSGSAHLYLYDLNSGELKHAITQNDATNEHPWVLRNTVRYHAGRRELFIQTAGRVPGRNPYYCDIARVNIDSGELTTLYSVDAELMVCDQASRMSTAHPSANGVSPSGRYVVTTQSRVDTAPESLLLDSNGERVLLLETADVSGLPADVTWPEPVLLKAADGNTDIHGVVFRPSHFDPEQSYPILDCSYHYGSPVGSFSNSHSGNWHYLSAWAYAELGFITVMILGRGNDGLRDTSFNQYQNPDFTMAPLNTCRCYKTDCIAGMQQLAERYSYIDIKRAGVVEFGSTPTALMGMLVHPDFYKVGVSMNAQANSRLEGDIAPGHALDEDLSLWDEFEDYAHQLKGKLLIINGMLDWCMYVTMTFRLIESLQKANKRFDMLLLPNVGHGACSYGVQRAYDYVVEHLRGETPPDNFKLTTVYDAFVEAEGDGELSAEDAAAKESNE